MEDEHKKSVQKQNPTSASKINQSPSVSEIQNLILEAKIGEAKGQIKLLLGVFSAIGIILPIVFVVLPIIISQNQETRVSNAITKMETKLEELTNKQEIELNAEITKLDNNFEKLAGKQLRKPQIICRDDNNELIENCVFENSIQSQHAHYINIINQGDGLAQPVDVYIYFKDEKKLLEKGQFANWEMKLCEDNNYSIKYLIGRCDHISPYDSFAIPIYCTYFNFPQDSNSYETNVLLKVFYGEQAPKLFPFTFKFIK